MKRNQTITTFWNLDCLLDWIIISLESENDPNVKTSAFFAANGKFMATVTKIYDFK